MKVASGQVKAGVGTSCVEVMVSVQTVVSPGMVVKSVQTEVSLIVISEVMVVDFVTSDRVTVNCSADTVVVSV